MPLTDFDRRLLDRCLRHEPGAWNEFVDRYLGLVYHVIHHVAHARTLKLSAEDVEDYAAEILLGLIDNDFATLRRFKGEASLPTYLAVVARRICIRQIVRRQREEQLGHATAHRALVDQDEPEIEETLAPEDVERMLAELPENEAEIIQLFHLRGMSYRQISQRLGISENSIGPILTKARRRLRQYVE